MVECRSWPSVARATFTIVVSRIDMPIPRITTLEISQTWDSIRSSFVRFRNIRCLTISDSGYLHLVTSFIELGLSPEILQALHDVGYESPSPIQEQAIPSLLQGKDVIGQAQTGSGKT